MSVIILITKDLRKPLYKLRKNNNPDEKRWIEITNKLAKKVLQNLIVLQDKYYKNFSFLNVFFSSTLRKLRTVLISRKSSNLYVVNSHLNDYL